jgi:hypothetical protein
VQPRQRPPVPRKRRLAGRIPQPQDPRTAVSASPQPHTQ